MRSASSSVRPEILARNLFRAGMAHDRVEKSREEKAVDVLAPFALDVGVISKSHSVGDRGRDRQALVCQHLHQHAAAVGNAVENVDLPAVMLDHIVAEASCLVHGRNKFRLRLAGVEAVVGDEHNVIPLRQFFGRGKHAKVAHAAAMQYDHELGVLLPEFKILHTLFSFPTMLLTSAAHSCGWQASSSSCCISCSWIMGCAKCCS